MIASMKVMFFGKPDIYGDQREYNRLIEGSKEQFGDDSVTVHDSDSRDSIAILEIYQVFNTPAVLVCREDGSPVAIWQHTLPTLSDISYFYQSER